MELRLNGRPTDQPTDRPTVHKIYAQSTAMLFLLSISCEEGALARGIYLTVGGGAYESLCVGSGFTIMLTAVLSKNLCCQQSSSEVRGSRSRAEMEHTSSIIKGIRMLFCTDGWTDGRTDGRMRGRTDGRTDRRTDGRTDGRND